MSAFQALPAAAPRDPPLPRGASGRARWNYGDCPVPLLDAPRRAAAFRSRKRERPQKRACSSRSLQREMALVNKRDLSGMTADLAASGVAAEELKQFVERVERLEEEKKAIAGDIRDLRGDERARIRCARSARDHQDQASGSLAAQRNGGNPRSLYDCPEHGLGRAASGRHPPSPGEAPVGCCAVLPRGKLSERRRAVI